MRVTANLSLVNRTRIFPYSVKWLLFMSLISVSSFEEFVIHAPISDISTTTGRLGVSVPLGTVESVPVESKTPKVSLSDPRLGKPGSADPLDLRAIGLR